MFRECGLYTKNFLHNSRKGKNFHRLLYPITFFYSSGIEWHLHAKYFFGKIFYKRMFDKNKIQYEAKMEKMIQYDQLL